MFIIFLTVKLSKSKRYCKDLTDLNVARFDQQFGTAPSKNPIVFVCLSAVCITVFTATWRAFAHNASRSIIASANEENGRRLG